MDQPVKLSFRKLGKKPDNLAYWPGSHIPIEPKLSLKLNPSTNKYHLFAKDVIGFNSDDNGDDNYNYFIATLDKKRQNSLVCKPSRLFRMMPNYEFKDLLIDQKQESEPQTRLTKKEQLDELKEKFGSRKTQRDLGMLFDSCCCYNIFIWFSLQPASENMRFSLVRMMSTVCRLSSRVK